VVLFRKILSDGTSSWRTGSKNCQINSQRYS